MRHADALPGPWDAFLFARGATVTHIYAFDRVQQRWVNPCQTIAVTSRCVVAAPVLRLCKLCDRATVQIDPHPSSLPGGPR
jgi:hypothetical protein